VLVVMITVLAGPINATTNVVSDPVGPNIHHKMTHSQGEHDMDMSVSRMSCDNPDCDNAVDCEKSCSLNGGCGSGTSTVVGPTCQPLTVSSFTSRLSLSLIRCYVLPSRKPCHALGSLKR